MSDPSKTVAESAYCELLAMPVPRTPLDFRRAVVMAALIGRQIEADFQSQKQPTTKPKVDTQTQMKREILLTHEATAIAAKNGLAGLPELAAHLHLEKGIRRGDAVINMNHSDDPTTAVGFYFNPAAGEGGVLMATAGASHEENVLEGTQFLFQANEIGEARAALLDLIRLHEPADVAPSFSVV